MIGEKYYRGDQIFMKFDFTCILSYHCLICFWGSSLRYHFLWFYVTYCGTDLGHVTSCTRHDSEILRTSLQLHICSQRQKRRNFRTRRLRSLRVFVNAGMRLNLLCG